MNSHIRNDTSVSIVDKPCHNLEYFELLNYVTVAPTHDIRGGDIVALVNN